MSRRRAEVPAGMQRVEVDLANLPRGMWVAILCKIAVAQGLVTADGAA